MRIWVNEVKSTYKYNTFSHYYLLTKQANSNSDTSSKYKSQNFW